MQTKISRRKINKSIIFISALIIISSIIIFSLKNRSLTTKEVSVGPEATESIQAGKFELKIPKINIESPVLTDVDPVNESEYDQKLKNGVALMKGAALPGGGTGNIFIYGHSSANEVSKYQKIFARLNELENDDEILVTYGENEYIYKVENKKIVEKNDLSVLADTRSETLTLMTCWPIGTDASRLIVSAIRS